jgi:hypothetical protein
LEAVEKVLMKLNNHKFFKSINWDDVYSKRLEVPPAIKPDLKSKNFPPIEVFGEYEDFESEYNTDNWSF